jgi:hypothetical protein
MPCHASSLGVVEGQVDVAGEALDTAYVESHRDMMRFAAKAGSEV